MADERMSDGEISRNFKRLDQRVNDLAKSVVPLDAWNRENIHVQDQIKEADRDCRDRSSAVESADRERSRLMMVSIARLENRTQLTVGRVITVAGILATLLAGWWAAFGLSKGIH